jgi:hypothetical protein
MATLILFKDNRQIFGLGLVCKVEGFGGIGYMWGIAYCQFISFLSSAIPIIQFRYSSSIAKTFLKQETSPTLIKSPFGSIFTVSLFGTQERGLCFSFNLFLQYFRCSFQYVPYKNIKQVSRLSKLITEILLRFD